MSSIAPSTTLRSRMEATTRAFLSAFEEGSTQNDSSLINRDLTPTCTRHLLPASVPQAFGLPPGFSFDNTTFEQAFAKDVKVLKFRSNIMSNLVIDTEARSAAFTSIAEVEPRNGGEVYTVEQAWFLYLSGDGVKVEKVVEFCDKDALLRMAGTAA